MGENPHQLPAKGAERCWYQLGFTRTKQCEHVTTHAPFSKGTRPLKLTLGDGPVMRESQWKWASCRWRGEMENRLSWRRGERDVVGTAEIRDSKVREYKK